MIHPSSYDAQPLVSMLLGSWILLLNCIFGFYDTGWLSPPLPHRQSQSSTQNQTATTEAGGQYSACHRFNFNSVQFSFDFTLCCRGIWIASWYAPKCDRKNSMLNEDRASTVPIISATAFVPARCLSVSIWQRFVLVTEVTILTGLPVHSVAYLCSTCDLKQQVQSRTSRPHQRSVPVNISPSIILTSPSASYQ